MTMKNFSRHIVLSRFALAVTLAEDGEKILAHPAGNITPLARDYVAKNKGRILEQLHCLECSETNISSMDFLEPNHRLLRPVLFVIKGQSKTFDAGECVHVFDRASNARAFIECFRPWVHDDQWAALKNQEKGYRLAWIGGDIRGIAMQKLAPLPYLHAYPEQIAA